MFKSNKFISNDIYDFYAPTGKVIGVVSIPHSGEVIPDEFSKYLTDDKKALFEDVDYRVRDLVDIEKLVDNGIAVIVAKVIRTCVDLNRSPEDAVLNWKQNTKGVQVVTSEATSDDELALRSKYYTPYYDALAEALNLLIQSRGTTPMIDLHSMPSRPTDFHLKYNPNQKMERPDFCVSNLLENKSCTEEFINYTVNEFTSAGYSAWINDPYFGGYVTKYVNKFDTNNIQIEIKREIYMDESIKELVQEKVVKLRPVLTDVVIKTIVNF